MFRAPMTAHFYFCPPTVAFLRRVRCGGGETFFQCNPNIFVTYEPMQNFKTIAQTLLGETAHFGFCLAEISFFRGKGGSPIFFNWNLPIFVTWEPMQKFKILR